MADNQRVNVSIENQIAYVSLARPKKHNALDMFMFKTIENTIKKLRKDRSIRAVILSGDGPDFCTGLDVKSVMKSPKNPLKLILKWLPWRSNLAQFVSTGWRTINAPVIAVIHGRCWGGGLQIALGADFRIATPDSNLSILESRWGLIPDMGGTLAFKEMCRMDVTKELAMTAKFIDGNLAKDHGLVTHISDDPMQHAKELAQTICQQSPDSVAAVKKLYQKSWYSSAGMALFRESYYQLKVLLGKNGKIKVHNQTNDEDNQREFIPRKKW